MFGVCTQAQKTLPGYPARAAACLFALLAVAVHLEKGGRAASRSRNEGGPRGTSGDDAIRHICRNRSRLPSPCSKNLYPLQEGGGAHRGLSGGVTVLGRGQGSAALGATTLRGSAAVARRLERPDAPPSPIFCGRSAFSLAFVECPRAPFPWYEWPGNHPPIAVAAMPGVLNPDGLKQGTNTNHVGGKGARFCVGAFSPLAVRLLECSSLSAVCNSLSPHPAMAV